MTAWAEEGGFEGLEGAGLLAVWAVKTAAAAPAANSNLRFKALLIVYDNE